MGQTPPGNANEPAERYRWACRFCVGGDLRFISHHDTMRLFRRALTRAEVPVRYSQGFNPQPKISLPLPRPVGIASDDDLLVMETEELIDPGDTLLRLQQHSPQDLSVMTVRRLDQGQKCQPEQAVYALDIRSLVEAGDAAEAVETILAAESLCVVREEGKRGRRELDIRPYIEDLRVEADVVVMTLRVTGTGTARPAEIAGLLGIDETTVNHRILRKHVRWSQESS